MTDGEQFPNEVRVVYTGAHEKMSVAMRGMVACLAETGDKVVHPEGITTYDFARTDVTGRPLTERLVHGYPSVPCAHPRHLAWFARRSHFVADL